MNIFLIIATTIGIIGTLLPMWDSRYWLVRTQINIRPYYLLYNVIFLVVLLFLGYWESSVGFLLIIGLLIAIVVCLYSIGPFLEIAPKSICDAANNDQGAAVSLLVFNVLQKNEEYGALVELVELLSPDIILLLELSEKWYDSIDTVRKDYAYEIKELRDDTYGILYLSKIPLVEAQINYLVKDNIPSTEAMHVIDGTHVRIIGLHPEPPIPGEVLSSKPKDFELITAARKIEALPHSEINIVLGDLNDVGWSKAVRKFKKISKLRDLREGRGLHPTFPTYMPFFRIPIDNVFCSKEIKLIKFEKQENIGSDHLPLYMQLLIPTSGSKI